MSKYNIRFLGGRSSNFPLLPEAKLLADRIPALAV